LCQKVIRWGDGTSRNNVSPYEPCHYALYNMFWLIQNYSDISMQGHCVSGTINLGDQGSQNIHTGTHRFGTSRHPTSYSNQAIYPWLRKPWDPISRGALYPWDIWFKGRGIPEYLFKDGLLRDVPSPHPMLQHSVTTPSTQLQRIAYSPAPATSLNHLARYRSPPQNFSIWYLILPKTTVHTAISTFIGSGCCELFSDHSSMC